MVDGLAVCRGRVVRADRCYEDGREALSECDPAPKYCAGIPVHTHVHDDSIVGTLANELGADGALRSRLLPIT